MRSRKIIKFKFHPNHTMNIYPSVFFKFAWADTEGPLFVKISPRVPINSDFIF